MTAKEFMKTKNPNDSTEPWDQDDVILFLDEYHAIASGNKINVDRKFDNVIDRDYKGEPLKPLE